MAKSERLQGVEDKRRRRTCTVHCMSNLKIMDMKKDVINVFYHFLKIQMLGNVRGLST